MANKFVKDFEFPAEFGFTGSATRNDNARPHAMDPAGDEDDGTYVSRARGGRARKATGGRIKKAGGGDIKQETLSAPNQSFGAAFKSARQTMLAGGPKTFQWNGKSYTTDLAPDTKASTGRAHLATMPPAKSPGQGGNSGPHPRDTAESGDLDTNMPTPPIPPDYRVGPAAGDFSSWSDRAAARPVNAAISKARDDWNTDQAAHSTAGQGMDTEQARRAAEFKANESEEAAANASVNYRRGGRVHRAMGGPLGQMPTGAPGGMAPPQPPSPPMDNPMSRATITMPVPDAHRIARGMLNVGAKVGAHQAVAGLANAARQRLAGAAQQMPAPAAAPAVPAMAKGGHLSAAERHALPSKDFALPGERYPINDAGHARNALARVSQHGSSSEKATVRAAVHRKFPAIGKK